MTHAANVCTHHCSYNLCEAMCGIEIQVEDKKFYLSEEMKMTPLAVAILALKLWL